MVVVAKVNIEMSPGLINLGAEMREAIKEGLRKVAKESEEAAKQDYLRQRKTNKMPSQIINSFVVDLGDNGLKAFVVAGGSRAPYAIYVDQGHTLRDGSFWSGYHFMEAGAEHGREIAKKTILEELKNL